MLRIRTGLGGCGGGELGDVREGGWERTRAALRVSVLRTLMGVPGVFGVDGGFVGGEVKVKRGQYLGSRRGVLCGV